MDWKMEWEGKYVFVKLNQGGVYSGKIIDVDDNDKNIVFITLTDKFGLRVTFIHSEILKIVEETP